MKEESFKFPLADFLAYLFPGTVALLATAAGLRLSPFKQLLAEIPLNFVTGLILIAFAYFIGVIISSLTYNFEDRLYKLYKLPHPLSNIPIEDLQANISEAFERIFGIQGPWSINHFYLARALVVEKMPNSAVIADRQNSLRQIRRNSLIPVLLFGLAGSYAGWRVIELNPTTGSIKAVGGALMVLSIIGSYGILRKLAKVGMYNNRRREAREICCSLLVFYVQNHKSAK